MTDLMQMETAETAARRLTDRIRTVLTTVQEQLNELLQLVEEARTADIHVALGYRSWTEYAESEFGDLRLRWPKPERQELVERLTGMGMSTRAIAPIAGVGNKTVARDREAVVSNDTTEYLRSPSETEGPPAEESTPVEPRAVTGRDGKEYRVSPRPSPVRQQQGRTNVVAVMGRVVSKASDAAEAAEHIKREHLRNRKEEATRWARDLNIAVQSLQRLAELLEENS